MQATYTKLRDGSWGLRVTGTPTAGQTVIVMTKAGATRHETVGRVIWTGNGIAICSVAQRQQQASGYARSGYYPRRSPSRRRSSSRSSAQ